MSENVPDQTPATNNPASIGKFPIWRRGVALLWVLSLCGLAAFAGLFIASFFGSVSGY